MKNQSEYLREMDIHGKAVNLDFSALKPIYKELNMIGNNLNQIARIGNKTNPLKTKNQLYVHAENLAFHLIQSFPKGEVTAEQAMKIGRETMEKFLKGQYEFVIATYVYTDCIHNHIIINSVNMTNKKSFSTEHDRKSYPAWLQVMRISDQILKEKGLSVIENPLNMSVSHYEWEL